MNNLFDAAYDCMMLTDPMDKARCASDLQSAWMRREYSLEPAAPPRRVEIPGRPQRPRLVEPSAVPRRGYHSKQGILNLAHAIAHIEFNAINLALDAVYRFRGMPAGYYDDWVRIAAEESEHFRMLVGYLGTRGVAYGDMDAHNGLWEAAVRTDHDALVRMALVPRVLEARGLDVTPGMMERLQSAGENELVGILDIINREEIGHVEAGSRWYRQLCAERRLDARVTFAALLAEYMKGSVRGPFEEQSRLQAGFTEDEIEDLVRMSRQR